MWCEDVVRGCGARMCYEAVLRGCYDGWVWCEVC